MVRFIFSLTLLLCLPVAHSSSGDKPSGVKKSTSELLSDIRARVVKLKYKWDLSFFTDQGWAVWGHSVDGYPLLYWTCGDPKKRDQSSLILSAVHGDEVTPVYFGFRIVEWLKARPELCKNRFVVVAPIVNPDGFLRYTRGTRTNFNKVDVNRNFHTPDWAVNAHKIWKEKYKSMRRYYPGDSAGSEPETKFQAWLINEYQPTKVLSVHAPLNILDYDGPADDRAVNFMQSYISSCDTLKNAIKTATPNLRLFAYGQFPGSLGNYAGKQRGIPVITAELPTTKAEEAPGYFSMMEKGTRTFIEFELKDVPVKAAVQEHDRPDGT